MTPYKIWNGQKPLVSHLRVFGCRASVLVPQVNKTKLDQMSWPGILVGYAQYQGDLKP